MGVRMNAPYDDGTVKLAVGDEHFGFTPRLEARMIRSGLADALPVESLDHARAQAGMEPLAQFDGDGDGAPGGSLAPDKSEELTEVRREYRETLGKAAYPGWDIAELRRRITEAGEG